MDPMLRGIAQVHASTRELIPSQGRPRTSSGRGSRQMKHERSRDAVREDKNTDTSTRDATNTLTSEGYLRMEVSSTSVVDLTADFEDEERVPGKY